MRLTRRRIIAIAVLAAAALVGVAAVQLALVRRTLALEREAFAHNVNAALADVVDALETAEAQRGIVELSVGAGDSDNPLLAMLRIRDPEARGAADRPVLLWPGRLHLPVQAVGRVVVVTLERPQTVRLVAPEGATLTEGTRAAGRYEYPLPACDRPDGCRYRLVLDDLTYDVVAGRIGIRHITVPLSAEHSRLALFSRVLTQYLGAEPVPIEARVDLEGLDTLVGDALSKRGITIPHALGVVSGDGAPVVAARPDGFRDAIGRSGYRARLFPHDVQPGTDDLVLFFPSERASLLGLVRVPTLLAAGFTAITIACFVIVLAGVGAQRRFSAMLTDFVNNVTHEFRTPVSTIALAADAMDQPAVAADEARRAKYRRIILDECARLRTQADKVLEMAALERREIALDLAPVDVHDLIGTAVEHLEPAVAGRQGRLTTALDAERSLVTGDAVHLLDVLHNLLDNALKYNERPPAIVVETSAAGGRLRVRVRDNGVGLTPGEAKRVFDPYYRVPRGDVHDVKGFGLGLGYVKHIVAAHGGAVRVTSVPGEGSVFEIELPLAAGREARAPDRRGEDGRRHR